MSGAQSGSQAWQTAHWAYVSTAVFKVALSVWLLAAASSTTTDSIPYSTPGTTGWLRCKQPLHVGYVGSTLACATACMICLMLSAVCSFKAIHNSRGLQAASASLTVNLSQTLSSCSARIAELVLRKWLANTGYSALCFGSGCPVSHDWQVKMFCIAAELHKRDTLNAPC